MQRKYQILKDMCKDIKAIGLTPFSKLKQKRVQKMTMYLKTDFSIIFHDKRTAKFEVYISAVSKHWAQKHLVGSRRTFGSGPK